jgi:hypothetical protein
MAQLEDELMSLGARKETLEVKRRRLVREGRLYATRVTNETFRYVTDARFHPSGEKVIATKWFTSEGRSIGAGEAWEYKVPSVADAEAHIPPKSGELRIGRTLPFGWTIERYGDQQIGPEQALWRSEDTLIYAKNVVDEPGGVFTYSKGSMSCVLPTEELMVLSFRCSQRYLRDLLA